MRIRDTRHQTLDKYSIQNVTVRFEILGKIVGPDGSKTDFLQPYLDVVLQPEPYMRNRFESGSYETKKHGAEALFIDCDELEVMVGALKQELEHCYSVLWQNGLFDKLDALKKASAKQPLPPAS
jgi:hypothetical protein